MDKTGKIPSSRITVWFFILIIVKGDRNPVLSE
jgi:hypothetical protein